VKYVLVVLRVVFLLFAYSILVSLIACIANYFYSGESDRINRELILWLTVCLMIFTALAIYFKSLDNRYGVKRVNHKDWIRRKKRAEKKS